ncbi:MAG: CBS domain-containing protein [Bdellovibrionota bacterium]
MTGKKKRKGVSKMTVEQIMTTEVVAVPSSTTIREVMNIMIEKQISGTPIVDANYRVLTIVTEGDLMKFAALSNLDEPLATFLPKLSKTEKLVTVSKSDNFHEVYKQLLTNPVRRVIVADASGRLQGIVSRRNVMKAFLASEGQDWEES